MNPVEAFVEIDGTKEFVCTATVDVNKVLSWSKIPFGETEPVAFLSSQFSNADYNTEDGTRTSTLILTSLTSIESSDSIRCYDTSDVGTTATVTLSVVGKSDC